MLPCDEDGFALASTSSTSSPAALASASLSRASWSFCRCSRARRRSRTRRFSSASPEPSDAASPFLELALALVGLGGRIDSSSTSPEPSDAALPFLGLALVLVGLGGRADSFSASPGSSDAAVLFGERELALVGFGGRIASWSRLIGPGGGSLSRDEVGSGDSTALARCGVGLLAAGPSSSKSSPYCIRVSSLDFGCCCGGFATMRTGPSLISGFFQIVNGDPSFMRIFGISFVGELLPALGGTSAFGDGTFSPLTAWTFFL
mmetsp:Transcript_3654/g.8139  ORF Transcript_3654/g.8139 Transcript_3654/m.8139 type:complete len:262 (-) Transcript_3654:718-1503(-)